MPIFCPFPAIIKHKTLFVLPKTFKISAFLLLALTVAANGQKKLIFKDVVYEEQVKTVMAYPQNNGPRDYQLPAIAPLQNQNLVLEFDDILEVKNNYYARLIHCNYDWSKSSLRDLDFMSEYNEFPINDYQSSSNTHLPYFHYRFNIPRVKIPGNYLLFVFREGSREDIILSKRIMIYDSQARITSNNQLAGQSTLSGTNQQINFLVNYGDIPVINPIETFHSVIRQNQRWDNARLEITPSFIREDIRQLEYRFFNQDKQWAAGNEFRFVDFRSLNFPGQNTERVERRVKPFELFVRIDAPRTDAVYAQYRDLNGHYVIENLDTHENTLTGQYLFANFTLTSPPLKGSSVYVVGQFNQWDRNEENKMKYNAATASYEASILLKQGRYDYQYFVQSADLPSYEVEGSHFETENSYEILVYYTSLQPRADLLIGYYPLTINAR